MPLSRVGPHGESRRPASRRADEYPPALFSIGAAALSAAPAPAPQIGAPTAQSTTQAFVIAANPLAAKGGAEVLERGGSAIDAAVAVQAMLSLVEPQSSGLGGGAFVTYLDGRNGKLTIYDGRETAPAGKDRDVHRGDGKKLELATQCFSGRSTGCPARSPCGPRKASMASAR